MTYCVAIKVNDGLVFCADTRTSAGVDDIRTYNKVHTFEYPGDRVLVLMSSGNLATTQTVLTQLKRDLANEATVNLRTVAHMYDAAEYVGQALVKAERDAAAKGTTSTVNLGATLILGGQILGDTPALYLIYPEGNCISTSPESSFLQIGELKYGKPILDRVVRPHVSLEDAARCALVSMDSTMKSNLSVGPPLDLILIRTSALTITQKLRFDVDTPIYAEISKGWGQQLLKAFGALPRFEWEQPLNTSMQQAAQQAHPQSQQQQSPTAAAPQQLLG